MEWRHARGAWLAWGLFVGLGCGPKVALFDGDGGSADGSAPASTTGGDGPGPPTGGPVEPPPPPPPPSTSTGVADSSVDTTAATFFPETDSSSDGFMFIFRADANPGDDGCDLWSEDCPPGQKCMPYASNGGPWDATKCSPLDPDPDLPGEPCNTIEGPGGGLDTCALHSMCFFVDLETGLGQCIPLCTGSPDEPGCDADCNSCTIFNGGVLPFCWQDCDPITQDCPADNGCYPLLESFGCMIDNAAPEAVVGSPCGDMNQCPPGLTCDFGGCAGEACCAALCSLDDPDACAEGPEPSTCTSLGIEGGSPDKACGIDPAPVGYCA